MHHFVEWFERFTYLVLIVFLVVVLLFTLLELGWLTFIGLFEVSPFRLESPELFELFGYFLLVLIGLELLETIKAYLERREFHVEIILLVAIIAIARKVILLARQLQANSSGSRWSSLLSAAVITSYVGRDCRILSRRTTVYPHPRGKKNPKRAAGKN